MQKRAVQFTKKPYLPLFSSETADKFAKDYAIKKSFRHALYLVTAHLHRQNQVAHALCTREFWLASLRLCISLYISDGARTSRGLACYARVLFSSCTVNFREPIDLLRKSIRHRGKCRGSQCVPRRRCMFCGRSLWLKLLLFGRKLFEPQPSLTDGGTPIQKRDPGCPATVLCGYV